MNKTMKHYEDTVYISTSPKELFIYVDDHKNFSSHMNKSSWMMGGGRMNIHADSKKFQKIGSHIKMEGTVFGIRLYLDEEVTHYDPPYRKQWQTVGDLNLLVIDHYKLGFEIEPKDNGSNFKVYIDYYLPQSAGSRILGTLFGRMYAKWCVGQMIKGSRSHFVTKK